MEFENDVKTYGTETSYVFGCGTCEFENDVKTYGTETTVNCDVTTACLRMM